MKLSAHAALLLAAAIPLTLSGADDLFEDRVVAKGEEFEITQNELDQAYVQQQARLASMGRSIPPAQRTEVEKSLLDQLIMKHLLLERATSEDRRQAADMVKQRIEMSGEEDLTRQAKLFDLSIEEFKEELVNQFAAMQVVEREFKNKVLITTEEAKAFYDENTARFETPERVRASHILLLTQNPAGGALSEAEKAEKRETAEKVLKLAKEGGDFAQLAAEYSEDPGSKDRGGEYTFGRGEMVPEFEKTAFNLKPGSISDIVTTQFGYHIIKLHEKLEPELRSFAEVEEQIKNALAQEQLQQVLIDYVAQKKEADEVEILLDKYKS